MRPPGGRFSTKCDKNRTVRAHSLTPTPCPSRGPRVAALASPRDVARRAFQPAHADALTRAGWSHIMSTRDNGKSQGPSKPVHGSMTSRLQQVSPSLRFHVVAGTRYPAVGQLELVTRNGGTTDATLDGASVLARTIDELKEYLDIGTINLSEAVVNSGIWALGPPGAGKSECITKPLAISELRKGSSVVLWEIKPEVSPLLIREAEALGIRVSCIDFTDPNSLGVNLLATDDESRAIAEIARFSTANTNPRSNDSLFWQQAFATHALALWEAGYRTWGQIGDVLGAGREGLLSVVGKLDSPSARATFDLQRGGGHNADTVLATANGYLNPFRSGTVRAITDTHELPKDLFQQQELIILKVSETHLSSLSGLYAACMMHLIDRAILAADAVPPSQRRPGRFFFEDIASLGGLGHELAQRSLTLRARRIGIIACVQSLAAIRSICPSAPEMLRDALSSIVALPGLSIADCDDIAQSTGRQQTLIEIELIDGDRQVQISHRPVITGDDIRNPANVHPQLGRPATFLLSNGLAFQAALTPAWRRPDLAMDAQERGWTIPARKRQLRPRPAKLPKKENPEANASSDLDAKIAKARKLIAFDKASLEARAWWRRFEQENVERKSLIIRLLDELIEHDATITEFYEAFLKSPSLNIQQVIDLMLTRRMTNASGTVRYLSGELCLKEHAGFYMFDGYLEPDQPEPLVSERSIRVAADEEFPLIGSTKSAAYWRRI